MTLDEVRECEQILLGEGKELPDEIDSDLLCHTILGFEDAEGQEVTGESEVWLQSWNSYRNNHDQSSVIEELHGQNRFFFASLAQAQPD